MTTRSSVVAVIMGGGRGTRLYPLTKERCKPAVPLAGKYRLVDIPISNCLNSGINRIFLLSQFNTASLHRHIQNTYNFDPFGGGFVDILSAEQTEKTTDWYQGTGDAVRRNLNHFRNYPHDLVLILSGDQLYRMDFAKVIDQHIRTGADVTIAAIALPTSQVEGLGLMGRLGAFGVLGRGDAALGHGGVEQGEHRGLVAVVHGQVAAVGGPDVGGFWVAHTLTLTACVSGRHPIARSPGHRWGSP